MRRKMVRAAVSAALVAIPMAALAGVKIGGMAQGEIGYWKDSSQGVVRSQGTNMLDNGAGRLWVSASQKLGYGLKGLAFFMFKVNTVGNTTFDTSAFGAPFDSGEKYVGLAGRFGSIKVGNVASPYKYAGGVTWDGFLYTDLQARGNGAMAGGVFGQNGYMSDSILYTSPDFAGFRLGVAYSPMNAGVNKSAGPRNMTAHHGDYSAALSWKALNWDVIIAHDHAGPTEAGLQTINPYMQLVGVGNGLNYVSDQTLGKAQNNSKIGAKYDFGVVSVMGQFENLDTAGQAGPTHDLFVGIHGHVGAWKPILQVGGTTDKYYGPDIKAMYVAVGTWYNFKKGFGVFGGYRRTRITGAGTLTHVVGAVNGTQNVFSIGLRKVF